MSYNKGECVRGLVSIITPSYNSEKYIAETINSVLNQTYENWEMLIVDDCSSDGTEKIVKSYYDDRIKFFKNPKNSGAAYSRNFALKQAQGEWIAFLDSDDLWKKDKLQHQLEFMMKNDYKFTCTARDEIDENSEQTGIYNTSPKHINKIGMYLYCWVGCLTVMYHVPTVGLIQIANLKKNNDYAMWLKVIKKTDCFFLNENLASYRVRSESISHDRFMKLVKAHYDLFRYGENLNPVFSFFMMCVNLVFGAYKKNVYSKRKRIE